MKMLVMLLIAGIELLVIRKYLATRSNRINSHRVEKNTAICYTVNRPERIKVDWLPYQEEVDEALEGYLAYLEVKERIQTRNKEVREAYLWDEVASIEQFRKRYGIAV